MSNLVHNWARQSRERRFRVNVLSPGPTRIPGLLGAAGPDVDQFAEAVVPLGRLADAEKIAEAALFLSSDAPSFVTGAELLPMAATPGPEAEPVPSKRWGAQAGFQC
ncbi:NAD(P)-dependent dehydrogenase (short-subunit alcohol dehydrogenase family) [Streptomyces luteogriseus]|nr:NAD(P)-dependent dehydrogenase (short-subunit alcohol dehydrogenase family) [Streptomyces luteogriseus]